MKYKLIIFDMDGLMFDTEKMYYESCKKFAADYGFSYDINKRNQMAGMSEAGIHRFIADDIGSEEKLHSLEINLKIIEKNILRVMKKYQKRRT